MVVGLCTHEAGFENIASPWLNVVGRERVAGTPRELRREHI